MVSRGEEKVSVRESVGFVCETLKDAGVVCLTPEALRLAKLDERGEVVRA